MNTFRMYDRKWHVLVRGDRPSEGEQVEVVRSDKTRYLVTLTSVQSFIEDDEYLCGFQDSQEITEHWDTPRENGEHAYSEQEQQLETPPRMTGGDALTRKINAIQERTWWQEREKSNDENFIST